MVGMSNPPCTFVTRRDDNGDPVHCGQPAICSFKGSNDEALYECAEHAPPHVVRQIAAQQRVKNAFNVRGMRVRCQSNRRYIVVGVRPPHLAGDGYRSFAQVIRRSDNPDTARMVADRYSRREFRCFAVVIDTTTGEEI